MLSDVVKDKLWIWGHDSGSHDNQYGLQASSRMTPAEGAFYLGVPNIIMVRYNDRPKPPFYQYAVTFRPLKQIEGMIFLASCICDLELETVEWTRQWISEVGDVDTQRLITSANWKTQIA